MKVIIIGSEGQLGSDLMKELGLEEEVIGLTHREIEIKDFKRTRKCLIDLEGDVIINTAAYHHVGNCEENPEESLKVNTFGVLYLAQISRELDIDLVHYSTDYVFDGESREGYTEKSQENPLNMYGLSKLWGEKLIGRYCNRYYIIRISGIYGENRCRAKGDNFVTKMMRYSREKEEVKVVNDEFSSPTPTIDIARNTKQLIRTGEYGLYHMASLGGCSWYDFARVIFEELKVGTRLVAGKSEGSWIRRPKYSILENERLKELGVCGMRGWKEGLIEYIKRWKSRGIEE